MWTEFNYGGERWTRKSYGAFEAHVRVHGARLYRVIEDPTGVVVADGSSVLTLERTQRMLDAMLSVVAARRTGEVQIAV